MSDFATIRMRGGTMIIAPRGLLPAQMANGTDVALTARLIRMFESDPGTVDSLRRNWGGLRLPVPANSPDAELIRQVRRALDRRDLVVMFMPDATPDAAEPYRAGMALPAKVADWTTGQKIEAALRGAATKLPGVIGDQVLAMLAPETILWSIGFLAALAVAQAFGVGEVVDAALALWAFYSAGIAGIAACGEFIGTTAKLVNAREPGDIERASDLYARALAVLGAAFLKRLLKGVRERKAAGGIREDMNRPVATRTAAPGSPTKGNVPAKQDYKPHNRNGGSVEAKSFKADRAGSPVRNKADVQNTLKLMGQGHPPERAKQFIESSKPGSFKDVELKKGDKLYAFTTTDKSKDPNSVFWMNKEQYQDVKSKFYNPATGEWDRAGIKQYSALPCFNKVDSFVTGQVRETHVGTSAVIGEASETVIYNDVPTKHVMYGGGGQTAPGFGMIDIFPEGTPP
jgi:hypothetical protein